MMTRWIANQWCGPISLVMLLASVAIAGCGGGGYEADFAKTVSASGKVTVGGKPQPHIRVTFLTDEGRPASGVSDETGAFELGTNRIGDGAVVGKYRVMFAFEDPNAAAPEAGREEVMDRIPVVKTAVPKKYLSPDTSGIEAEVTESGPNEFTFDLVE
jgi:hypothetical protein